jgi:two-component system OmpR family response regulator
MARRPVVALVGLATDVGAALAAYLDRRGYEIRTADEAWEAEALLSSPGIDLAILGAALPQSAGSDLLRKYGGDSGPIFVKVCHAADLLEKVLALEMGAADVIDSPINIRELATRIGGLLARKGRATRELAIFENSTVDLRAALVMHRSGTEEQLSSGQVALLRLFLSSPRKVLTRDDIMAAAPAESADAFDRSIDSRIVRLRRKLDTESITTIRGAGYRFDPPTHAPD